MKPRLIILAFTVVLWSALCFAGDYEDGSVAFKRGDYKTALALYTRAANKGHTQAQIHLGIMYREGKGVPQDYNQAALWFRKAAEQGNSFDSSFAQYMLGQMYDSGQGVPQDDNVAMFWYRKAAEEGNFSFAQASLGFMYENGRGVAQDYNQAATWYRKAAEEGVPLAQIRLASMYAEGRGVTQSYVEAHKWYSLAAAFADSSHVVLDKELRDLAIRGRDNAAEKIKEAQIQAQQSQPAYMACIEGPPALKKLDALEEKGQVYSLDRFGVPITPERMAEVFIADCSEFIGYLPVIGMDKSIIDLCQTNLDYMKCWLQNRRDKKKQN